MLRGRLCINPLVYACLKKIIDSFNELADILRFFADIFARGRKDKFRVLKKFYQVGKEYRANLHFELSEGFSPRFCVLCIPEFFKNFIDYIA